MTKTSNFHNNRYRHWYDKVFTQEEIKSFFGEGWQELIDYAYRMVSYLPDAEICSAKRCMGMLHMYGKSENDEINNAIEGILWKIERLSATKCEGCGKRGKRRKELKRMYCYCNNCYLEYLNKDVENTENLFKEGQGGLFTNEE